MADALLNELDSEFTIACPAFPATRRSIYKGNLFVDDIPLAESGMRNHPLTPMRDSNLVRVLSRQTDAKVALVDYDTVRLGAAAIADACRDYSEQAYRYAIVDALHDDDLINIGKACAHLKLVTGGSGVALGLPENFRDAGLIGNWSAASLSGFTGRRAVLIGSCSIASRRQLAAVVNIWPHYILDLLTIADGNDVVDKVLSWAQQQDEDLPLIVSSSADPLTLERTQAHLGQKFAADLIERAFGEIATGLVQQGVNRLIVAGGETSGSVISAIGINGLKIGPEIDPGVPWCETLGASNLAVALKSGNFGSEHFFEKAFGMMT